MTANKRDVRNSSLPYLGTSTGTEESEINGKNIFFQKLMKNQETKALLLELLSQDNETIINYKNTLSCETKTERQFSSKNKLRLESPSALWKRRAKEKGQTCNINLSSTLDNLPSSKTVPYKELLKGVVAYVELKCKGEDASSGAKRLMEAMGAEVREKFTKDVTHVVFKDGSFNTYYKAKLLKVHLVSISWLDAIKTTGVRVPEKKFPCLGFTSKDHNLTKICLDFQNEYDEMVQEEFENTLALTTEILSQSLTPDKYLTNERQKSSKSSKSDLNGSNSEKNSLDYIPAIDRNTSTKKWIQNIRDSCNSDQLGCSDDDSDGNSDCGIVNGCSSRKSKELLELNESITNSCYEIDKLIDETKISVSDAFIKSGFKKLLSVENISFNTEDGLNNKGRQSTSTSDSRSLLTGKQVRNKNRPNRKDCSKNSFLTEELSSLKISLDSIQNVDKNNHILNKNDALKNLQDKEKFSNISTNSINNNNTNSTNDLSDELSIKNAIEKQSNQSGQLRNDDGESERKEHEPNCDTKINAESQNEFISSGIKGKTSSNKKQLIAKIVLTKKSKKSSELINELQNTVNVKHLTEQTLNSSLDKSETKRRRRKLYNPDELFVEDNQEKNEEYQKEPKNITSRINTQLSKAAKHSKHSKVKNRSITSEDESDLKKTKILTQNSDKSKNILLSNINVENTETLNDSQRDYSQRDYSPCHKQKDENEFNKKIVNDLAIRRSTRLKIKKFTQRSKENTENNDKRRSSFDFVPKGKKPTRKKIKKPEQKISIVCTRLHSPDVLMFTQIVKKMGTFFVENEVSEKTTHLVAGEASRTINMLKALTRGCWILKIEWLYKSLEARRWLEEEDYELTEFSPAVQQCRKQRQAFGSQFSMDIFENVGPIFVSRASIPRCSDLQELVVLCKGTISKSARSASVVVGEIVHNINAVCISEKWILDSITSNKRKSFKNYILQ